ncbi:hypothetical protein PLICRDRAFT_207631 [Plicaturopsis crispa FD-325 SS-3]|nr:hypothetical protein PLICRDRAFT_207631 [Plicaturopsis crispa FD-325 SS-3]
MLFSLPALRTFHGVEKLAWVRKTTEFRVSERLAPRRTRREKQGNDSVSQKTSGNKQKACLETLTTALSFCYRGRRVRAISFHQPRPRPKSHVIRVV